MGQFPCSRVERELLSLPCHFGGLNIPNPTSNSDFQFSSSELVNECRLSCLDKAAGQKFLIPYLQLACSTIRQSGHQLLTSNLEDVKSHVDS